MKIKLSMALCIGALVLCFTNLKAQQSPPPPTVASLQLAPPFTASHLQAAERVLELSGTLENMKKVFTSFIQSQSAQVPEGQRAAVISVLQSFFNKYVTDDEIKKAFVPIYAAEFTETELNQIGDFLSSPAGKAMVAKQPELMSQGMQWGQNLVQEHQQELEDMMKEALNGK